MADNKYSKAFLDWFKKTYGIAFYSTRKMGNVPLERQTIDPEIGNVEEIYTYWNEYISPESGFPQKIEESQKKYEEYTAQQLPDKLTLLSGEEVSVQWGKQEGVDSHGDRAIYYIPTFLTDKPMSSLQNDIMANIYISQIDEGKLIKPEPATSADIKAAKMEPEDILFGAKYTNLMSNLQKQGIDETTLNMPEVQQYLQSEATNRDEFSSPTYLFGMERLFKKLKKYPQYRTQILSKLPGSPVKYQVSPEEETGQAQTLMNLFTTGKITKRHNYANPKEYLEDVMNTLGPAYRDWKEREKLGLYNRQTPQGEAEYAAGGVLETYESAAQEYKSFLPDIDPSEYTPMTLKQYQEATAPLTAGGAQYGEEEDYYTQGLEAAANKQKREALEADKKRWMQLVERSRTPQRVAKL